MRLGIILHNKVHIYYAHVITCITTIVLILTTKRLSGVESLYEKLPIAQLVKKFPAVYEKHLSITREI
jgi:hypothetical protein